MASHKKSTSWTSIRKLCHTEKAMDPLASLIYCKKENCYQEWGNQPVFDRTKRKLLMKDLSSLNKKEWDEMTPREFICNQRANKEYIAQFGSPYQSETLRGEWWQGPPGAGKTRFAHQEYPELFRKMKNKWWDGYTGQKTILLDDILDDKMGPRLLDWADHYPCRGEIKGGTIPL